MSFISSLKHRKKKSLWLSLPNAFVFNTAPGSVIVCLIGEATFFPCFLCSGATFILWVCLLLLPGQQPHADHAPLPQEKEMHLHQKIFIFSKKSLGVFVTLLSVPLSHCHKQTTSFESSYWHKSTAQKTVKLNCSVKKKTRKLLLHQELGLEISSGRWWEKRAVGLCLLDSLSYPNCITHK